jgi:hypothetical protein
MIPSGRSWLRRRTPGPVTFEVDGHEFDAQKGDTILIPKGTPYNMWASNAHVLLVNAPAFKNPEILPPSLKQLDDNGGADRSGVTPH